MYLYATIQHNVVQNIFSWELETPPSPTDDIHFIDVTENDTMPSIGDICDDGNFVSPYIFNNTLEQIKIDKIALLKSNASQAILSVYPEYKQLNLQKWSDFGYTEQDYKNMVIYINSVRTRCNAFENIIGSMSTKEDVINFNIEL